MLETVVPNVKEKRIHKRMKCYFLLSVAIRLRQVSGRGKDLFRARKQNTSRPPSMHVDDFMAMGHRGGMGHRQVCILPLSLTLSNT